MAYLFGICICFVVFAASALFRLLVFRRIRNEIALQSSGTLREGSGDDPNLIELLREHKTLFHASRTRLLSNILIGVQSLAAAAALALIIAAQFQPHSLFRLISAAR